MRNTLGSKVQEATAYSDLALQHQSEGRLEQATELLKRSIEINPYQGSAYYYLVQGQCITEDDLPLITRIQDLLTDAKLSNRELEFLAYAAGKANEDLGDYPAAMVHFDLANRFVRLRCPSLDEFDPQAFCAGYARFQEIFSRLSKVGGVSNSEPILIAGMIRSGTTLLEQILSSHPHIGALGESPFWVSQCGRAVDFASGEVDGPALTRLAEEYLQLLTPGVRKFTDKMPANVSLLGLIHMALPNTRIIHIYREPLDNCLSIYTTRFEVPPRYAGNLTNIATAYRMNAEMMRFWKDRISPERLISVSYQDLLIDRHSVAKRLIEFCDLKWDEACLDHTKNERSVQTPSLWRVRQAIDTTSVNRYERFDPWAQQLGESLSKIAA